ncbi:class F sortase [Planococcus soli]|uniref:class F sortase n=2 Tax=Planococcus soli TaxID=2666072 RepID=UPI00115EE480|nr:class F sortase [Planococcus soli]
MKQAITMSIALLLCITLFFIIEPLADRPTFEEEIEQIVLPEEEEKTSTEEKTFGKYTDKIGEFPILPEQQKKLQQLQSERQQSIKGIEPTQIEIPSIGVDAAIEPTGILENGEMGVPEDVNQVGWFEPGYKAGSQGHAVLAGHVDSLNGPAVFYDLTKVKIGELVTLTDTEGRKMIFEVKEINSYQTDQAPVEEIFGKSDKRMLNLITCTGNYSRDIGSYEERLVISAELVSDSQVSDELPEPPLNTKVSSFNITWHAVRDAAIIGYRVYEEDVTTGEMKKIESVSLFDRKNVKINATDNKRYYVTSVDVDLNESQKIEAKK